MSCINLDQLLTNTERVKTERKEVGSHCRVPLDTGSCLCFMSSQLQIVVVWVWLSREFPSKLIYFPDGNLPLEVVDPLRPQQHLRQHRHRRKIEEKFCKNISARWVLPWKFGYSSVPM